MSVGFLRHLLAHPLTSSLCIDDPATTELRKQIITSKPLLKAIYEEWYRALADGLPAVEGKILELGSGAGFCDQVLPGVITSEVFFCSGVRMVADGQQLPFEDGSLRAIVMTNVLHHMPDVRLFFAEAIRCLRKGGRILMVEPWVTWWSRLVYTRLHHEPFDPEAADWSFPARGHLSSANSAIPWIVFVRDRSKFESEFPELSVERIRPTLPFRYLLSGGVGMRSLTPGFLRDVCARIESAFNPFMDHAGMFAYISVRRK
jgi:SAM-dependent methyltransferase